MDFSRQEYWSGWDLSDPGIEHKSPAMQAGSLLSEPPRKPQHNSEEYFMKLLEHMGIN